MYLLHSKPPSSSCTCAPQCLKSQHLSSWVVWSLTAASSPPRHQIKHREDAPLVLCLQWSYHYWLGPCWQVLQTFMSGGLQPCVCTQHNVITSRAANPRCFHFLTRLSPALVSKHTDWTDMQTFPIEKIKSIPSVEWLWDKQRPWKHICAIQTQQWFWFSFLKPRLSPVLVFQPTFDRQVLGGWSVWTGGLEVVWVSISAG